MKSDIRCWFKGVTWRKLRSEIPKPASYSSVYRKRNLSECELSTPIRCYSWYRQHLMDSGWNALWQSNSEFLLMDFWSSWNSCLENGFPRAQLKLPEWINVVPRSLSLSLPPSRDCCDCIPPFPPFHHIHHGCSQASAYFFSLSLPSHWKNSSASFLPPFSSLQMNMKPEQGKIREC